MFAGHNVGGREFVHSSRCAGIDAIAAGCRLHVGQNKDLQYEYVAAYDCVYVYVNVYVNGYVNMYVHIHVYAYLHVYGCMGVCVYVCMW